MTALKWLDQEEGFKDKPYFDTEGVATFGGGLTYITKEESDHIVQGRVYEITKSLDWKYDWFGKLSDNRKVVIISMVYQLGMTGFSAFRKCVKNIEDGNFDKAAAEMKDSKAYRQTTNRWDRQIELFING